MNVESSFRVLSRIWGKREGYVFLPWIDGDCTTPEQRRKSYHEGRAFDWPKEKQAVLAHMKKHTEDDLYFCPNLFDAKRRASNFAREERALWADLDEVDPQEIDGELQPTIAWSTSPDRYQAIWLLTADALLASEPGGLGQRLTYHLGADLGGWDATQLLRPPGWRNHKPEYKKKWGDEGAPGKLFWQGGPRYDPRELHRDLPEITVTYGSEEVLEQELRAVDRHKVMARISMKLPHQVKKLIRASGVGDHDRSQKLFYIEQSLAEVGCTLSEIVAIVRPTVWNKFEGRNDELKRLQIEAAKAIEKAQHEAEQKDDEESDFEVADYPSIQRWEVLAEQAKKPRWLVQDIWTKGACGIIAGAPKSMKSYIALDLLVSIISGEPFLGKFKVKEQGPVLYLQEEDPVAEVDERLQRITKDRSPDYDPRSYMVPRRKGVGPLWGPSKLDLYASVREGITLTEPETLEWLDAQLAEREYKALFLDPLGMFLGDVDENRFSELNTRLLKPLKLLAHKHGVAVVIVHHTTKSSDHNIARVGNALLGSRALHAWTEDMMYVYRRKDTDTRLTVTRESKRASTLRIKMEPTFKERGWQPNLLDEAKEIPGVTLATHKALLELGAGYHDAVVIADTAGIKLASVRVQLSNMKKEGLVTNNGNSRWGLVGQKEEN